MAARFRPTIKMLFVLLSVAVPSIGCAQPDPDESRGPLPGVAAVPSGGPKVALPPAANDLFPSSQTPPAASLSDLARIYIAGLQRALPSHGYHPGPETGLLDPATAAAIIAYQRDAGLAQDPSSPMSLQTTLDSVNFARPPVMAR